MNKRRVLLVFVAFMAVAVLHGLYVDYVHPSRSSSGGSGASVSSDSGASESGGGSVMRFETFVLQDDPQGLGGEVSHMLIPAGWKTSGGMAYDLNSLYPAQTNLRVYDPNSSAWFACYPSNYYIWGDLNLAVGTNDGGAIVQQPVTDAFEVIKQILIPMYRPELAGATIVETENLPKVAELASQQQPPVPGTEANVQAGRVRLEYTLDGKPVEEDFFAVLRVQTAQGFELWNTEQLLSVRADKGNLDDIRKLHEVSLRSCKNTLPWFNKYAQLLQWRHENAMAFIHSVGELSHQISQNNDEISDGIRQSYENAQAADDAISEARAETMLGETPWDAGDGNKVLLPATYGRAFRDDSGQYLVTNDSSYDPNADNNLHTSWTPMQELQH